LNATIADWLEAIASLVAAIVGLILLRQLKLMQVQVEHAATELESGVQWNKLNAAFTYFSTDLLLASERKAIAALRHAGFDLLFSETALNQEQLAALKQDSDRYLDVKDLLNVLEDYCTAVRVGAIDSDAAYEMMGGFVVRFQRLLRPVIADRRSIDPKVFCELESLADEWGRRFAEEQAGRGITQKV